MGAGVSCNAMKAWKGHTPRYELYDLASSELDTGSDKFLLQPIDGLCVRVCVYMCVCVNVCMYVCERERERERGVRV